MSPRPSTVATTVGAVICLGLLTLTLAVFVTAIVQGTGGAGLVVVGALCVFLAGATTLLYRRRARAMAESPAPRQPAPRVAAPRVPSRRPSPRPR
ncbi:hypothetical protein F4553_007246 [Allocatelliglobosispora scoriae]|uniref:Uncharacterized protein n=1 Tax=Allocatelliglobosispora scoriae TaxID=643052 RepID=A0A841C423_9ACTN|nr:hypothetical protein [Allocatelliglobosispora scoriae]MBB5873812.1 hypothetical protein [Allocatelliglobosispora scoriae]